MNLKSRIGEKSGVFEDVISADRLRKFALSVGAPLDSKTPPTILTVCRKGEFAIFEKLGLPLSRILHGEQEYVIENSVKAGDTLSYETSLQNVLEKRSTTSQLQILTFETMVKAVDRPIGTSRTTIIIRGGI